MKRAVLICLFVLCAFLGMAQKDTIVKKFGDVTPEDFEPSAMELLGGYKAVILQNVRNVFFDIYQYRSTCMGLRFSNTYHIRYKALEDNFMDDNKFVIPYSGRFFYDIVPDVKAAVYSLDNRKVVTRKIKFKKISRINSDSVHSQIVINFPSIKKGDIVDIQYTIASFNILDPEKWDFHHEYPCVLSRVETDFPDFYVYDHIVTGDDIAVEHTVSNHYLTMRGPSYRVLNTYNMPIGSGPILFKFNGIKNVFTAFNTLPIDTVFAFMPQKDFNDAQLYLRPNEFSDKNGLTPLSVSNTWKNLTLEIISYMDPDVRYLPENMALKREPAYVQFESSNWKRFTKRLRQSPTFWKPLQKSFEVTGELADIYNRADDMDSTTLLSKLYGYVTSHVKWDGTYSNAIRQKPIEVLTRGIGSSADINATLVALLKRAGFEALPVLSATRNMGMVDTTYVNLKQFNNILAYVSFTDGGTPFSYIIDATDPDRNYDVLNKANINNKYLVMDTERHGFVSWHRDYADALTISARIDGHRCTVSEALSTGVFKEEDHIRDTVFDVGNANLNSLFKVLMGENPFPELVRTIPVDFVVPRRYIYTIMSKNPLDGHFANESFVALGSLKGNIVSDQEDGMYVYQVQCYITKPFFSVAAYDDLRQFFDKLYSVTKQ